LYQPILTSGENRIVWTSIDFCSIGNLTSKALFHLACYARIISPKRTRVLNTCSNVIICMYTKCVMSCKQEIAL